MFEDCIPSPSVCYDLEKVGKKLETVFCWAKRENLYRLCDNFDLNSCKRNGDPLYTDVVPAPLADESSRELPECIAVVRDIVDGDTYVYLKIYKEMGMWFVSYCCKSYVYMRVSSIKLSDALILMLIELHKRNQVARSMDKFLLTKKKDKHGA